jgi:hypothetical protein
MEGGQFMATIDDIKAAILAEFPNGLPQQQGG